MFKNFHAIAIAAATSGLLVLSVSPSLACYVTATPCTELPDQGAHHGAILYNMVHSGHTMNSLRPSARYHFPRRLPAEAKLK